MDLPRCVWLVLDTILTGYSRYGTTMFKRGLKGYRVFECGYINHTVLSYYVGVLKRKI